MAKKTENEKVNKSEAIREAYEELPKAKVKEIVAKLGEQGITVTPGLVYHIKTRMKHQKRKQVRQKVEKMGIPNPVDLILQVKKLAVEAGGIKKLQTLVEALGE